MPKGIEKFSSFPGSQNTLFKAVQGTQVLRMLKTFLNRVAIAKASAKEGLYEAEEKV